MIQYLRSALVGCVVCVASASQLTAQDVQPAHFHHVVINAVDPAKSIQFYSRVFGASPVRFRGVSDGLFVEKSFILFNKVDQPANSKLDTGIWHIGWGGVDVKNEFEWWKRHDVVIHTPATPLQGTDNFYMYISGPDKELIEINTMGHHRFGHVHFYCRDTLETANWYVKNLGLKATLRGGAPAPTASTQAAGSTEPKAPGTRNQPFYIQCDNVLMIYYSGPRGVSEVQPTKDHAIDRIGFSYRNVEPVYERMKAAGMKIIEPLAERPQFKLKSFTIEGPDKVSIEFVEAKPVPEGAWD